MKTNANYEAFLISCKSQCWFIKLSELRTLSFWSKVKNSHTNVYSKNIYQICSYIPLHWPLNFIRKKKQEQLKEIPFKTMTLTICKNASLSSSPCTSLSRNKVCGVWPSIVVNRISQLVNCILYSLCQFLVAVLFWMFDMPWPLWPIEFSHVLSWMRVLRISDKERRI